MVTDPATN